MFFAWPMFAFCGAWQFFRFLLTGFRPKSETKEELERIFEANFEAYSGSNLRTFVGGNFGSFPVYEVDCIGNFGRNTGFAVDNIADFVDFEAKHSR